MALNVDEVLELAYIKFEEKKYDQALELFIAVYNAGYEKKAILQNLYDCYISGNETVFRETFGHRNGKKIDLYDECNLDFYPYKDGEYYIYNRIEEKFEGVFSSEKLEQTKQEQILDVLEFTPITLSFDGTWEKFFSILTSATSRKIYTICSNRGRIISNFKIPEIKKYMDNVVIFQNLEEYQKYFHEHTAEYLPRIVFASENEAEKINAILDKEHQYRLTEEGRNRDNILLTIGIPTHDRGNLLLKRLDNLLQMPYDAEIEIAISKNGTHYYQKEYETVDKLPDTRINYVGYDKEMYPCENWANLMSISHGKFVLMVSDEDDVMIEALEHYLNLLFHNEGIGMVCAKTKFQYAHIEQKRYYKKGVDALEEGFLTNNYLSGQIYNRQFFLEQNIVEWNFKYRNNKFYYLYPHMWWQVLLCLKGDLAIDDICLINEGTSCWKEETKKYAMEKDIEDAHGSAEENENIIGIVSTYESRMEQFCGLIEMIKDFKEFDKEIKVETLIMAVDKNVYLMTMVCNAFGYKKEELDLWIEKLFDKAIDTIEELNLDKELRKNALKRLLNSLNYVSLSE